MAPRRPLVLAPLVPRPHELIQQPDPEAGPPGLVDVARRRATSTSPGSPASGSGCWMSSCGRGTSGARTRGRLGAMPEVLFYQLEGRALESVLPDLLLRS